MKPTGRYLPFVDSTTDINSPPEFLTVTRILISYLGSTRFPKNGALMDGTVGVELRTFANFSFTVLLFSSRDKASLYISADSANLPLSSRVYSLFVNALI